MELWIQVSVQDQTSSPLTGPALHFESKKQLLRNESLHVRSPADVNDLATRPVLMNMVAVDIKPHARTSSTLELQEAGSTHKCIYVET